MTYAVTKQHTKGILAGLTTKELTGVKFEEGKDYGNYTCTFCREVRPNDCIAVIGSKFGIEKAFASCDPEYAKSLAKYWRGIGYDVHMELQDEEEN